MIERMPGVFRALRHRPFALLWSGQSISRLGDRLFNIALAWWVLERTGSAVAMGAVFLFTTIPMLAFLLIGGALVDRLPRLRLMLASDLARGVILVLMAALAALDWLEIWHVYLFSLIFGFLDAFFQPAYRAILPEIAPRDDLPSANSLTSLSAELSGIAGPAIGAALVALVGVPAAFAVNGLSFAVSVACLLPIRKLDLAPRAAAPGRRLLADVREGIGAVLGAPWLWVTIGVAGVANITYAGPMEVGLPFLIKDNLHADVGLLGLFYSLMSAGAMAGALWLGGHARIRRRGLKLYAVWAPIGLLVMVIGLPVPVAVVLAAALLIGVCNSLLSLIWTNMLQEFVPPELLGRVASVDYLGSYCLLPVGFAAGGWAVERFGAPLVFVVGGACTALLISAGLLHPRIREMD